MGGAYAGAAAFVALPAPLPQGAAPSACCGSSSVSSPAVASASLSLRARTTVLRAEPSRGIASGIAAAAAAAAALIPQRRRREAVIARQSGTSSRQYRDGPANNRGVDAKRLLGALRGAGLSKTQPTDDADAEAASDPRGALLARRTKSYGSKSDVKSMAANGPGALSILREERRLALEQGRAATSSIAKRREYRLPLLVKYNKPVGQAATMRNIRARDKNAEGTPFVEDLRTTVSKAGDRFELDLYHPVGSLPTKTGGLLLWSRSGKLTKQLTSTSRGVVHEFIVEVNGAVDEEQLRQELRAGVKMGFAGFEFKRHADIVESCLLPESSLQEPRSRMTIRTIDGRSQIPKMLKACGFDIRQISVRRTRIGALCLDSIPDGDMDAASEEEEAWACGLGELPTEEYPAGYLPSVRSQPVEDESVLSVGDGWSDEEDEMSLLMDEDEDVERPSDSSEPEEELSVWDQQGARQG